MNQEKKRVSVGNGLKQQTAATVCFLLLSGLFLYACVMLVGSLLKRELLQKPPAPFAQNAGEEAAPAPSDTPAPAEPVSAVLAPPAPGHFPTPTPEPGSAATPSPSPTPAPSPTPVPTLRPLTSAAPFSSERAEFVLIGFDEKARADWYVIVRMQNARCTVLSVPRNTLSAAQTPLMNAASITHATRLLRTVWPVSYPYYVELQLPGLPLCVEQCGGVTMEGVAYTGEQAEAYLKESAGDELLRIARQQTLMRAFLRQLQQTSWLKLLTFKFTLQDFVDSNFSTAQLLPLYTHFQKIDVDEIVFCTLPVDSTSIENERRYLGDAAQINRLLSEWETD